MQITLSNTEHQVLLRFQPSAEELINLRANKVLFNESRVFNMTDLKKSSGGQLMVTTGFRKAPVMVRFGWYNVELYREELFLTDCPNHQFLKKLRDVLLKGVQPKPEAVEPEPGEAIVVERRIRRVRGGKLVKRVITQDDTIRVAAEDRVWQEQRLKQPKTVSKKQRAKRPSDGPVVSKVSQFKLEALMSKFK